MTEHNSLKIKFPNWFLISVIVILSIDQLRLIGESIIDYIDDHLTEETDEIPESVKHLYC